jgi:DNA polymerase-3 subunit delta
MPGFYGKKDKGPSFTERQQKLNEELKAGRFAGSYLLYGPQDYLRTQNRKKLKTAILEGSDASMNCTEFRGDDFTAEQIIDLAETLPFFGEHRLILLENTGLWGKSMKSEADKLAEYIGTQPETTIFLVSDQEIDKRQKLYNALHKHGTVLECDDPDEKSFHAWTCSLFLRRGKKMSEATLAQFLQCTGSDMLNIQSEADKLISYVGERELIESADVDAICSRRIQDRVFDLIAAIGSRQADRALAIYMELLSLQTPPQIILSLMERQYEQMLQLKEALAAGGKSDYDISRDIGMPYGAFKQYSPVLPDYSAGQLKQSLEQCLQADTDYKNGKLTDRLAIEMLIAGLTQKTQK